MTRSGAMAALRAATAERHRRLEDQLHLLADDLSADRWTRTLVGMLGVVEPLEAALDEVPPPLDDWPERRRASLLRADAGDPDDVAPCDVLPAVTSPERALGCLYVLEGSTLGGRVVASHVSRVLGPDAGTRWFAAYGPDVRRRWSAFGAAAEARCTDLDEMADAACGTFDAFLRWVR